MKKLLLTAEVEIDENEVASIEDYTNEYKTGMTVDEYVEGLTGEYYGGAFQILNPIEEYYNKNLGDSNAIKSFKVINKSLINWPLPIARVITEYCYIVIGSRVQNPAVDYKK